MEQPAQKVSVSQIMVSWLSGGQCCSDVGLLTDHPPLFLSTSSIQHIMVWMLTVFFSMIPPPPHTHTHTQQHTLSVSTNY